MQQNNINITLCYIVSNHLPLKEIRNGEISRSEYNARTFKCKPLASRTVGYLTLKMV